MPPHARRCTPQTLPVRVYEAGVKIMVAAPVPGLAPEDITVAIDGDRVLIHGAQRGPNQPTSASRPVVR